jgi:Skp family chaperone for outer membrane proteins
VKRTILLIAGAAALGLAYYGSQLLAQGPGGAGGSGAAPVMHGTRVAVVNIGAVFTKYQKATYYKQEMEEAFKPYKTQIETGQKQIYNLKVEAQKPSSNKEQLEQQIVAIQRSLEDVQRKARSELSKKSEQQLQQLWNEINDVINATARTNAFNIVLAYGEPSDVEAKGLGAFANINRKMTALESGSALPMYFDASVDITPVVVDTLNRSMQRPATATPAAQSSATPSPGR